MRAGFAAVGFVMALFPSFASGSEKWSRPQVPVHIHGNTYYVGTAGLSAILIRGSEGAILLDGTLATAAPLVEANIRSLGVRMDEVKLILNSHAHFDHAGGIAALKQSSGARVAASPSSAQALRLGHAVADDPQAGYIDGAKWPPVHRVDDVRDGETLRIGNLAVTAHFTPGHAPGSTTWTWRSCEADVCVDVVYADSLNAIAAPGFRFLDAPNHADLVTSFRQSIRTLSELPCDILITVHPEYFALDSRTQRQRDDPAVNPFIERDACRNLARRFDAVLDARIESERGDAGT